MPICLIFLPNTLVEETYLSLVLDGSKQIQAPLEHRSFAQLKDLQHQAHTSTYLIFPSQLATLYHLLAPRLALKKAVTAIHFFLETKLPQPLDTLHIAYQYQDDTKSYLIGVVDKKLVETLFEHYSQHQLYFDGMVVDASLLNQGEGLYHEPGLYLIHTPSFHGAIPSAFEPLYESCLHELTCYTNQPLPENASVFLKTQHIDEASAIWLAKRMDPQAGLNLSQGEFSVSSSHAPKHFPLWVGILSLVWLCTLLLGQGIQLYRLHHLNASLTAQITTHYKQLFPQAKVIPHSTFQLSQYLKKAQPISAFWRLIDSVGVLAAQQPFTIETLSFQNSTMTLMVSMQDFKQLEKLELTLKKLGLNVNQRQANQQDKTIQATLELS
ncbi:MAG: type II secretion system protein GspL [Gammaproteobacteria bacterium]|nr:type II secretion system protein GspL [Gammaproteobacteria bacterium]